MFLACVVHQGFPLEKRTYMGSVATSGQEIKTFEALQSHENTWRKLHAEGARPTAFSTWEWLWHWWKQFGTVGESETGVFQEPLLLLTVRDAEGEPIGMLPLYFSFHRKKGILLTVLRMVGDVEDVRQNPFEEPLVLLKRGREREVIDAMEAYLQRIGGMVGWDYTRLSFPCFAEAGEPCLEARKTPWEVVAHRSVHSTEEFPLPDSYETFRRSLSKSMRDNLSYYPRLLRRRGHSATMRVATTPAEVRAASETLIDLHQRRASGARGLRHMDHLPTCVQQDFQRGCLSDLAAKGMASIYFLEIDGAAVAAQSVLHYPEGICFYYSGFDMDWYDFSPLTILATGILKDAIASGVKSVNLLTGAKPWKTRWGARSVERFQRVTRLRMNPSSLLRCAAYGMTREFDGERSRGRERAWLSRNEETAGVTAS